MSDLYKAFFFAHYWAWALIWAHVLIYFGRFAYHSWQNSGGTWRRIPCEAVDLVRWTVTPLWGDTKAFVLGRPLPADDKTAYRYDKSHRLSLFVAMSSLGYVFMGTIFATVDRSTRDPKLLFLSVIFIAMACIAGLGHLLTPLESNPRRWRWFVLSILCWYPTATTCYWLYLKSSALA